MKHLDSVVVVNTVIRVSYDESIKPLLVLNTLSGVLDSLLLLLSKNGTHYFGHSATVTACASDSDDLTPPTSILGLADAFC